jgi:hypothetical protein
VGGVRGVGRRHHEIMATAASWHGGRAMMLLRRINRWAKDPWNERCILSAVAHATALASARGWGNYVEDLCAEFEAT